MSYRAVSFVRDLKGYCANRESRIANLVCCGSHTIASRVKDRAGYSLTEVMASITILALAIIPMVAMFDTGLKAAGASGDYDKARALANLVLEDAKGLPYEEVRDGLQASSDAPDTFLPLSAAAVDFAGFEYEIDGQYLRRPPTGSGREPAPPTHTFSESAEDEGLIRLTVTVRWGEDKTYTATGLVADGVQ